MFITRNDEKLKFYGAGMRGGNVLGCMAGMCCKMCYTEPVEVRARKRETAGMRG